MSLSDLMARDLMSPEVESAAAGETLIEAAGRMAQHSIHCLIVPPDSPGRSAGIITAKDIVQLMGDAEPEMLEELLVGEAMTRPAMTLPGHTRVPDCINLMRMSGVRSVPVMEGDEIVGIFSFSDVLRWLVENR